MAQNQEGTEVAAIEATGSAAVDASRRDLAIALISALGGAFGLAALSACSDGAPTATSEPEPTRSLAEALSGNGVLRVVDTVTNLRALTGGTTLWIAVMQGYSSAGDGGGGVFYWSTTAQADNGWSVLNSGSGNSAGWRRVNPGVVEVDTVTTLRATNSVARGVAILCGYWSAGDGGGGLFLWSTTSAADDGGTIFNSGGLGSSSAGWRRIFSGPLDVRWFGANPSQIPATNVTSITWANAAAAKGSGSGRVYFPAGTYTFNAPLQIFTNVEWFGDGCGSPPSPSASSPSTTAVTVLSLVNPCSSCSAASAAITADSVYGWAIRKMQVQSIFNGIHVGASAAWNYHGVIEDIYIASVGSGCAGLLLDGSASGPYYPEFTSIKNLTVNGGGAAGVTGVLSQGTGALNLTWFGGQITNCANGINVAAGAIWDVYAVEFDGIQNSGRGWAVNVGAINLARFHNIRTEDATIDNYVQFAPGSFGCVFDSNVEIATTSQLVDSGGSNTILTAAASTPAAWPITNMPFRFGAQVNFGGQTTSTSSPGAGTAGALPSNPAGYWTLIINGNAQKVPYY
jgi:hypothetical protein